MTSIVDSVTAMPRAPVIGGRAVPFERMPGHWVLARLGKKVLRPGGRELTDRLLDGLAIDSGSDVVELAPGVGATTELVLDRGPRSYVGVDRDAAAVARVTALLDGSDRRVQEGSAADTGLADGSADIAFGEAFLTMQSDERKLRITAELARIVRPGGRIGLHEVALDGGPVAFEAARAEMTSALKVRVRPLSADGWADLVESSGFRVLDRWSVPLHLLEPQRLVADEGVLGASRFAFELARRGDARARVVAMRRTMRRHTAHLRGFGLVAERVDDRR